SLEYPLIGRTFRAILGVLLIVSIAQFFLRGNWRFNLLSIGVAIGLLVVYVIANFVVSNYLRHISSWMGAFIAMVPLILVYILGTGEGLIFGHGEGQMGALTFLGASLLFAGWRGDSGCEVMSIPNALFGRTTRLACLFFSPIDWLERKIFKAK
ncbi:hypothetical protein L0156_27270, partial [bacterium]|nr:hypothetical protein [bacterium]